MAIKGKDVLVYLAVKYNGDWNAIYKAIKDKELVDEHNIMSTVREAYEKYTVTTIIDDRYPNSLKKIYKPPFVLFSDKPIGLALERTDYTLAIMNSHKGLNHEEIGPMSVILNKVVDVNRTAFAGLANDDFAELGFNIHATRTDRSWSIRVHDGSLEGVVSKDNLINISEYFKGNPSENNTPWATRLVIGLSAGLYTPHIGKTGNNLIGVGYAMYLGRHVMANRATNKATMDIFKHGGIMVDSAEDVTNALYNNGDAPKPDSDALEGSPIA
jgi:DNA processing protein